MNEKLNVTEQIYRNFPIKDWYELLRRKEKKSYYSDLPFERLIKDLKWEIDELAEWIDKWDLENIKEELADVILNTQQVIQALFKRWLVTTEDLRWTWKAEKEKIYYRTPFIRSWERLIDWEHETQLFKQRKEELKALLSSN